MSFVMYNMPDVIRVWLCSDKHLLPFLTKALIIVCLYSVTFMINFYFPAIHKIQNLISSRIIVTKLAPKFLRISSLLLIILSLTS
jgi:hypothetical protein